MSADSLGVAIDKPLREVLGPAAPYMCVLHQLHFEQNTPSEENLVST
jgi:hypothetical protein